MSNASREHARQSPTMHGPNERASAQASVDPVAVLRHRTVPHPGRPKRSRRVNGAAIDPDDWTTRAFLAFADVLGRYHRHRVVHLARLQTPLRRGRRVLLVGNHALDIVDPLLLLATVFRRVHRVPRFIGHESGWFQVPVLRRISARFHVIPSRRPDEALAALFRDGFLMLYPGGVTEAGMRRYRDEPYRLKWAGRAGFLRLALDADADVVFVAAVGSDEAYYQSRLSVPERLVRLLDSGDGSRYRGMPLAFGLCGIHLLPGVFPLPVRLTHVLSGPLDLGDREAARRDPGAFARLHERVWHDCQRFLDDAVAARDEYSDPLDRSVRRAEQLLQRFRL